MRDNRVQKPLKDMSVYMHIMSLKWPDGPMTCASMYDKNYNTVRYLTKKMPGKYLPKGTFKTKVTYIYINKDYNEL